KRRRTARFLLPLVGLPLIQEAVFGGSDQLARAAAVVRVISLMTSGQCHRGAVMEIIVPQRVEPITAALGRAHQPGLLRLVLADNESRSAATRRPHLPDDGSENMIFRLIENLLGRIKPQAVEMIFVDPIPRVGDEEFPCRT